MKVVVNFIDGKNGNVSKHEFRDVTSVSIDDKKHLVLKYRNGSAYIRESLISYYMVFDED